MAIRPQSSFAAGELDPALWERTTLEKYDSGLAVGRNVIVRKTGAIASRPGRKFFKKAKLSGRKCILFCPPYSGYTIEFGHLYFRVYDGSGNLVMDAAQPLTEDQLPFVHFTSTKTYFYVFCFAQYVSKYSFTTYPQPVSYENSTYYSRPGPSITNVVGSGTGYLCDYIATAMVAGEETNTGGGGYASLPISTGQNNDITITVTPDLIDANALANTTEVRVYRRPNAGGAYGYIGSTTVFGVSGANRNYFFRDLGVGADYTHGPPEYLTFGPGFGASDHFKPRTGLIYQQRFILAGSPIDEEEILASRTKFQGNFKRDFPLAADSAMQFKAGSTGYAKVLRMIDSGGLVVFTSVGIYRNTGALTPDNLILDKGSGYIIDDRVPPLVVPGGTLFVDVSTNSIRELKFSFEGQKFEAPELSIFSAHLFAGKRVLAWCHQDGDVAVLWVSMNDGKYLSLTFDPTQEMRAWTRHDSQCNIEYVANNGVPGESVFLVEKNGERYLEKTIARIPSAASIALDPQAIIGETMAAMDSLVTFQTKLNASLTGTNKLNLLPVAPNVWDGNLNIFSGTDAIFTDPGNGTVGTIFRWFNPVTMQTVDLQVVQRINSTQVVVSPSDMFPSEYANGATIYNTFDTFSGLDHMEGELVAVIIDGGVYASPNNDDENYNEVTVVGGQVVLDGARGAIVHIGRPYTSDVQMLEPATVEQRPILLESKTINKFYTKLYNSRGIYAGNEFPKNDKVNGMELIGEGLVSYESQDPIDADNDLIPNTYQKPETRRDEATAAGKWNQWAGLCFRNVDPVHFEISSIIPDLDDERRQG